MHEKQQQTFQLSHPPTPKREPTEIEARDAALDAMERWRTKAVELGRAAAARILAEKGRVTSVEVEAALRADGHGDLLDSIDGRWLGAVFRFRAGSGMKRTGWEPTGSHGRPVAIWERG